MNCSGAMTARCQRAETRAYRCGLEVIHLCDICHAKAEELGMAPRPVAAWVERAQERRLPAKVYV